MTGDANTPIQVKAGDIVQFPGGTLYRIVMSRFTASRPAFQIKVGAQAPAQSPEARRIVNEGLGRLVS